MKLKKITQMILILLCFNNSWSQQDAQYTHYMYSATSINPAYAGSRGVMTIFGLHRNQFAGKGAPISNVVSFNAPINESKIGVGLTFTNEYSSLICKNNLAADLSYTFDLPHQYKLSFGIKGRMSMFDFNFKKFSKYNNTESKFNNNIDQKIFPDFGAGVYLHTEKFYAGISIPSTLKTIYYDRTAGESTSSFAFNREIITYLMTGYMFNLDYNLKLRTSFLARLMSGAPLQTDLSANLLFNEKFNGGLGYRSDKVISGMVGYQVSEGLLIGYSYDKVTNKMAQYNEGTHEIFMRFEFFENYERVVSPRYF